MQLEYWQKNKYFYSGTYAGYVEKVFYDYSVDNTERNEFTPSNFWAPAHFWAGRYAAIFGEDMTDYILTCFEPSFQLTDVLYNSMEAYIKDGSGYETTHATKALYDRAMEDCGYITEEMREFVESLEEIQSRPDWDSIFATLYEENKTEFLQLMQEELSAWKVSKYFSSGLSAGSIENLILDKYEEKNDDQL